jgi:hypothetical protein
MNFQVTTIVFKVPRGFRIKYSLQMMAWAMVGRNVSKAIGVVLAIFATLVTVDALAGRQSNWFLAPLVLCGTVLLSGVINFVIAAIMVYSRGVYYPGAEIRSTLLPDRILLVGAAGAVRIFPIDATTDAKTFAGQTRLWRNGALELALPAQILPIEWALYVREHCQISLRQRLITE